MEYLVIYKVTHVLKVVHMLESDVDVGRSSLARRENILAEKAASGCISVAESHPNSSNDSNAGCDGKVRKTRG